jgi:diguanylate cyclase (GGDEF)-like protein
LCPICVQVAGEHADGAVVDTRLHDQALVARVLLVIWLGGSTTFTLDILIAPPAHASMAPLWTVSAIAYCATSALWLGRRRLPAWTPDASGYLCYALATTVMIASRDTASPYAFFYLWVTVVSCYFVPIRRAIPQILVVPACYALALAVIGGPFPWFRWALLGLTVGVVGASIAGLRRRVERLFALLADTARTDTLTELRNRRAFDELLEVELERAARTDQPLGLLIADIDHFKAVNDRYGHPAGDEVLRDVAAAIRASVRNIDVAARIGGEEFAVLAPGNDAASAHLLAERIRRHVADKLSAGPVPVTISFGVAAYPQHGPDATSLTGAADAALYDAKARGRNRTVSAAAPLAARGAGLPGRVHPRASA